MATPQLPRAAATLLRVMLPYAERDEVLEDLEVEFRTRIDRTGRAAARRWLWRQVLASVPALMKRGWWRGWSGFETRSDGVRPGGAMFEGLAMDLRYALRRLRMRPTYAVLTVLTLSLGVAGTAAVYSIVERLLLQPLPYADEDEVVQFWMPGAWSESELLYLRPEMRGFQNVAAVRDRDVTIVQNDAPARLLRGISGSAELFDVLGVSPALGPGFEPGVDRNGAEPVVVLSHSLWQELGADPAVVGTSIELSGVARTVVGVMPEGFWYPDPMVKLWLAEQLDPQDESGNYALIARVDEGMSPTEMTESVANVTWMLDERYDFPVDWDLTKNAELTSIRQTLLGTVQPALLALLGAMVVILLIACVNVAALMLGEMDSRATELSVRTALGAARPRLLRQLVAESSVIGVLSGLAGAGIAVLGFRVLVMALPLGELASNASIDWNVFGAAMAIALLAAVSVALIPGAALVRRDVQSQLAATRTGGVVARGGRVESALVVAQVSLVVLLASGAALLIRSVDNLRSITTGVDPTGVAVVDVLIPVTTQREEIPQVMRELLTAAEAVPGVASAAATQRLPLRGSSDNWGIILEGSPGYENTATAVRVVSPAYFETMRIGLLSGRGLEEADRALTTEGIVVINEALAEKYFSGVDPIGHRIAFMPGRWDRIVGVAENVAESGLTDTDVPTRYFLYEHGSWLVNAQTIVLRTEDGVDPVSVLDSARRGIQQAAPSVAVRELTTMESVRTRSLGPAHQVMSLLSILSGLALTLGAIGVYGAVSHFVTRRRRDWGIRLALGMRPRSVVGSIVRRGGLLVGAGIVMGLIGFRLLSHALTSFLYQVDPNDPLALLLAASVLAAAGLIAAFVPARRAGRIDPAVVLREQ